MTRIFLLLALAISPLLTMADDAPTVGRLFHTSQERQALDRIRENGSAQEPTALERISLDGVVKRDNGKSTTWINGVARHEGEHPQGILVNGKQGGSAAASMQLSSGKQINLKPGQSYDVKSESLQDVIGAPRQKNEKKTSTPPAR